MTSLPTNLNCKVVKKKRGECKWSELAFEDAETGERRKPKVVLPEARISYERSVATSSSRAPLHSHMSMFDDAISVLSMDDDDESWCGSSIRSSKSSASLRTKDDKTKRRGQLSRFAEHIGKRLGKDRGDDHTVSTSASSLYTTDTLGDGLGSPSSPPTDIRTAPPCRLNFLQKQRNALTQRYVGFKEVSQRQQQSEERRGTILTSLYTCMEDDDEEDLLNTILLGTRNTAINCAG